MKTMPFVLSLSKHERLGDAPFDCSTGSQLRVNGGKRSENYRGLRSVFEEYVFSIMDSFVMNRLGELIEKGGDLLSASARVSFKYWWTLF